MKLLLSFFLLLWLTTAKDYVKRELKNWKMKITEGPQTASLVLNKEYQVSVPSTIHLNLEKHKAIPDPFFSDNIKSLEWISSCQVSFTTNITIFEQDKLFSKIKLIFEGIDTYADVYLNDQKLGSTNNAFLKYQFAVQGHVKVGANTLRVHINSTKPYDTDQQRKDRMPFEYAHTRKACYQYSWDWAPYMNTMGIWLPARLQLYDQVKIDYVWIRNKEITRAKAVLDIVLALDKVDDQLSTTDNIELKVKHNLAERVYHVASKYSHVEIDIDKPQLWWPNNIGTPHLYVFQFQLLKNGNKVDQKRIIHGIRTVQLNEQGNAFKIIVNGYPIYCKGANYVPPDMMYPRLINSDFKAKNSFQQLLQDAVESNFNMLRVWGGGQYEVDEFYELASGKGIMIFQDFMFSDSIYPGTDPFLENVKQEVIYQVRRIRNYPCVVLWSGNNEILQGIQAWGWGQSNYVQNYEKVFKKLIPDILNVESKDLPYIQSSPSRGVGNAGFGRGGDIHYWGVWAAGSPFENYQLAVGGFNSEFGTQSLPVWKSILQFTNQIERNYDSAAFLSHQRHNSQFRTLKNYLFKYAHASINFELEAFVNGLVQAYGIEIAIRSQRLAKPRSFGTLYWQFNDAWPSISWSSIDYYGRWKPLQYTAKSLYSDIILLYHPKNKKVTAINDKLFNVSTYYLVKALTFDGKVLFKEEGKLDLSANAIEYVLTVPAAVISQNEARCLVYTEISYGPYEDNKTVVTTFHKPYKNLEIEDAVLHIKFVEGKNIIEFSSEYLIKSLFIDCDIKVKLSKNYFDVVPGHITKVHVKGITSLNSIREKFHFKSYRQVFDPATLRVSII